MDTPELADELAETRWEFFFAQGDTRTICSIRSDPTRNCNRTLYGSKASMTVQHVINRATKHTKVWVCRHYSKRRLEYGLNW
jgi:hypothetical protein